MISAIRMAFQALAANKLRSLLTMLGTIVGVSCVVALWNIGQSGRMFMNNSLSSIGQNLLFVMPRFNKDDENQKRNRYHPLTLADVAAIQDNCPSVAEVSPVLFGNANAVYGSRNRSTQVLGVYPSYTSIRDWKLETGVFLSESDVRNSKRVVLLGSKVAQDLFGTLDPVGEKIRLGTEPFIIMGVLKSKGSSFGEDQDDRILVPFTSLADHMGFSRNLHMLMASAKDRSLIPQAKHEILMAVRASQRIPPDRKDSVEIQDLGELMTSVDGVLLGITALLGAIGAISLLVGGIGIMNIMLVSVTERTKEIGLRMALGATDINILSQFLIEAMVLSGVGGVIGIGCGFGAASATVKILTFTTGQEWPIVISMISAGVAFTFSLFVGIFFGFYPAWRASRLDPIVALRHE